MAYFEVLSKVAGKEFVDFLHPRASTEAFLA